MSLKFFIVKITGTCVETSNITKTNNLVAKSRNSFRANYSDIR